MPAPDSPRSPLGPPPGSALDEAQLRAAAGPAWSVDLLPRAESTNAVAAAGPVAHRIVVADHQTAGRGRLDRSWETPPGTALTFSVVVDPALADEDWPVLPLATALAVADGVRRAAGVDPQLKWPNDLLLDDSGAEAGAGAEPTRERKLAGILLERVADPADPARPLAVIGIGINVAMSRAQLPVATATSLEIAGAHVDRTQVFGEVVHSLSRTLERLAADPSAILERYRGACTTTGRQVEVHLPDGTVLRGLAEDVDRYGRLVVAGQAVGAGDVVHVRPDVT